MHINRIKSMQGAGIFRQFVWPTSLQDFGRYNLIYGWNGTGKSTLSRIFQCLESRTTPDGTVTLIIDGNEVPGSGFTGTSVPIRVFNREFVEKNVLASTQAAQGAPEVPAIFVIGEKNVESQREADAARENLQKLQVVLLGERAKQATATAALDTFCSDQARLVKELLRGSGSAYNNYNKADFKAKALELNQRRDASAWILDDAARAERVKKHQSTPREKLTSLSYEPPDLAKLHEEAAASLKCVVTSAVIESLKRDPEAASWIEQGLAKHIARKASSCLFCDQPLPAARLDALNAHFNDAYQAFLLDLDKQIARLDELEKERSAVAIPKSTEVYDHLAVGHKSAAEDAEAALATVRIALASVRKKLVAKRDAPFESRSIDDLSAKVDAESFVRLNKIIGEHNRHSQQFAEQVKKARAELEVSHVAAALTSFRKYLQAVEDARAKLAATTTTVNELTNRIATLERELRDHRRPADELNRDLKSYLGHGDIQLTMSSTGYTITRHGNLATRLSEGEQTAIALLYFLKTLASKDFKLQGGIVVLDDPVCSLDSNAMFSAFAFIKARTKDAEQLFVLTHNFTFFRQIRSWFHKLAHQNKKDISVRPARFYMLRCLTLTGKRCSEICWLDPLLEQYESDYHYLFSRVNNLAKGPTQQLDDYVGAPNLARKLMETFLAFHTPGASGETVFDKLDRVNFDEHKKTRILRFLNDHSHSSSIGGEQQDFTILNETPAVLPDLLAMIEIADKHHYDGMMTIVSPATAPPTQ